MLTKIMWQCPYWGPQNVFILLGGGAIAQRAKMASGRASGEQGAVVTMPFFSLRPASSWSFCIMYLKTNVDKNYVGNVYVRIEK